MIVDGSDAGCSPLPAVSDAPVPAAELENATARRDAGESRFGQSDASNHDKVKRKENTICKCAFARTSDERIEDTCLIHSDIGRPTNTSGEGKAEKGNQTCTQSNE